MSAWWHPLSFHKRTPCLHSADQNSLPLNWGESGEFVKKPTNNNYKLGWRITEVLRHHELQQKWTENNSQIIWKSSVFSIMLGFVVTHDVPTSAILILQKNQNDGHTYIEKFEPQWFFSIFHILCPHKQNMCQDVKSLHCICFTSNSTTSEHQTRNKTVWFLQQWKQELQFDNEMT